MLRGKHWRTMGLSIFACLLALPVYYPAKTSGADSAYDSDLAALWANEAYLKPDTANPRIDVGHPAIAEDIELTNPEFIRVDDEIWAYHIYRDYENGYRLSIGRATSADGVDFMDDIKVLGVGSPGSTDDVFASFPGIWLEDGIYYLVYEGYGTGNKGHIELATSTDGIHFAKQGTILEPSPSGWDSMNVGTPTLYKEGDTWYLYFAGWEGTQVQIGLATGEDLFDLTKYASNPVIASGLPGGPDEGTVGKRSVTYEDGYYYMFYETSSAVNDGYAFDFSEWSFTVARSSDLIHWTKHRQNHLIPATRDHYGNDGPSFLEMDGVNWVYYRYGDYPYNSYARRARIASETSGGYDRAYEAEAMGHAVGRAEGEGWAANPTDDPDSGYLTYGPYATDVPKGENIAVVKARIDDATSDNLPVMRIDVYDRVTGLILESRTIRRQQFAAADHDEFFSIPFVNTSDTHQLEFRVYWYNRSSLNVDRVLLNYGNFSTQQPPVFPAVGPTSAPPVFLPASPSGDALQLQIDNHNKGPLEREYYYYNKFSDAAYTFQSGDYIEYDVKLNHYVSGAGGIEVVATDGSYLRGSAAWQDQNGLSGHPATDLSQYAYGNWYHRKLPVPSGMIGKTAAHWDVAGANAKLGNRYSALYDNIVVTDGSGTVRHTVFRDGDEGNLDEPYIWKVAYKIMSIEDTDIVPPSAPEPGPPAAPEPPPLTEYYNDSNVLPTDRYSFINRGTGWVSEQNEDNSGGTAAYSNVAGDYALFRFYGTDIGFYSDKGDNRGIAAISIDGGPEKLVDLYSPNRLKNELVWSSENMAYMEHTLKIRVTGDRNPVSAGAYVLNEGVKVDRLAKAPYYNDSLVGAGDHRFQFAGSGWTQENNASASGETVRYSNVADDYATFTFQGTKVSLHSDPGANRGIAAVSIDGGPEENVDLYSTIGLWDRKVWTSPILPEGTHTLKVRVTGGKNASSAGAYVLVDGLSVTPDSSLPPYYNDDDKGSGSQQFQYAGTGWVTEPTEYSSGRTVTYSNVADDTTTFVFYGTQADWFASKSSNSGKAAISVDGGPETLVDLFAAEAQRNAKVWSSPVLASGAHTLTVRVTGDKQAGSSGAYVLNEGVRVTPIAYDTPYYNENVTGSGLYEFDYDGAGWVGENRAEASGGTVKYSNVTNDAVSFKFKGTQIGWHADPGSNRGVAAVSVDGGPEALVDLYEAGGSWDRLVWSSPVLTDGEHTLTVRVTGDKHAASTGRYVLIDGFSVMPGYFNEDLAGTGPLQFEYTGTGWVNESHAAASGGSVNYSNAANDEATFRFNGTQVSWYAKKGANGGIAAVSVDGGTETPIDLYAPENEFDKLVWTSPVLAPGDHAITIRVTGDGNPYSLGDYIVMDGMRVIGGERLSVPVIGAEPEGDVLKLTVTNTETGTHYAYRNFAAVPYVFQNGDRIAYDVKLSQPVPGAGGIEVTATDGTYLRTDTDWKDANDLPGHPSADLSAIAYGAWHRRVLAVPDSMIGKTALYWDVAGSNREHEATYSALYDNIVVLDAGGAVKKVIFSSEADLNRDSLSFGSQASAAVSVENADD